MIAEAPLPGGPAAASGLADRILYLQPDGGRPLDAQFEDCALQLRRPGLEWLAVDLDPFEGTLEESLAVSGLLRGAAEVGLTVLLVNCRERLWAQLQDFRVPGEIHHALSVAALYPSGEAPGRILEMHLQSALEQIPRIRPLMARAGVESNLPFDRLQRLVEAVEETVEHAVQTGSPAGRRSQVRLSVEALPGRLRVEVRDSGASRELSRLAALRERVDRVDLLPTPTGLVVRLTQHR